MRNEQTLHLYDQEIALMYEQHKNELREKRMYGNKLELAG